MRRVTRNFVLGLLVVLVALLALGALPGLLASGDPYFVTAERVDPGENRTTVDATNLSEQRFPYVTRALEEGRSGSYYDGPVGLKEAFSHSPFDELNELEARNGAAVENRTAFVTRGNETYRLDLIRESPDDAGTPTPTTANGTATSVRTPRAPAVAGGVRT